MSEYMPPEFGPDFEVPRISYRPPSIDDITDIVTTGHYDKKEIATMMGISLKQFRKYTGGNRPRQFSYSHMFAFAAFCTLTDEQIDHIHYTMQMCGCDIRVAGDKCRSERWNIADDYYEHNNRNEP